MKYFYKFLSFILVFIFLFSNIVYAGGNGQFDSNAGGSDSSTAGGGSGSSTATQTLYSNTSGYRLTLIDPVTSEVKSKSIDILFSIPSDNALIFRNSRVEELSRDSTNWKAYTVNDIIQRLHNVGYTQEIQIPTWFSRVGNEFNGEGLSFKEWFLSDNALDYLSGTLELSKKVISEREEKRKELIDISLATALIHVTKITRPETNYYYMTKDDLTNLYESVYNVVLDENAPFLDKINNVWIFLNTYNVLIERSLDNLFDMIKFRVQMSQLWNILKVQYPTEMNNYVLKAGNLTYPGNLNISSSKKYITKIEEYASLNTYNKSDVSDTSDNVSSNTLYLDEERGIFNTDLYGWALPILDLYDYDINLNKNISIFSKKGENKTNKEIVDSFKNGEVYICVEPILFFKPQTEKKGNYSYIVYGTAKNWADFCVNHLSATWVNYDTGGALFRGSNRALMAGLILENNEGDFVDSSGKTVLGLANQKNRIPFVKDNPYWNGRKENTKNGDMAPMIVPSGLHEPRYTFSYAKALMDKNIGIGMQIYCVGQGTSSINTYEVETQPTTDFFPESSLKKTTEGKDYIEKNKDREFQIAKFYRIKVGDYVKEFSHYYMIKTPHIIDITDEIDIGWKLKEWYTSESDWLPDMGEAPDEYNWENVVKKKNSIGTYSGTEAQHLVVSPDDPDKTLYLLYEMQEPDTDDDANLEVIKVYEDENGNTDKVSDPEIITGTSYEVPIEDDYIYTENKKSPNPSKDVSGWSETEGNPGTETTITIDDTTETIYILYRKNTNSQIKLYSNELSYTYGLKDIAGITENRVLFSIYDTVPSSGATLPYCPGTHGRSDWSHSEGSPHIVDGRWSISVKNKETYSSSNFIRDYVDKGRLSITGSLGYSETDGKSISIDSPEVVRPDGDFLLYRDKESDLVTLYPNKNDSLSPELIKIGLTSDRVSYTPQGNRMSKELINDTQFLRDFTVNLDYTEHDTSLSWEWIRSSYYGEEEEGDFSTNVVTSPTDANNYYNKSNNVKTYYLLGQSNTGNAEVSDIRDNDFANKYKYNKAYSSTSADLKFYPYSLMLYRAKNDNSNPKEVYVTSENLSTMKVYNAVQLGVYKKNPINALLDSTQWSTHARSLAFEANTDKKSVLPGGAVLDLSMGSKGDTQLGIRLWQSCLRDEQVQTVQPDSFNTSLSKAKEIATTYQNEVKSVLEGYGLVQWGTEGVSTDLNSILSSGVELHNNTSLDWDGRSYSTSNDSKYYLKHNGEGSDRANFDVLESKIVNQTFYEISSDVNGTITLTKDGSYLASSKLGESIDIILSNPEAKLLDDNTKLVTNYFSAIDRNLGDANKYDRENLRKYNEAYDGVGVLLTDLIFDIGFGSNSGHRTTVLDTLLTSTSNSKSDLYNFSDDKVRSFVFATTDVSLNHEIQGYVGTLSGDSTMSELSTVLSDIQSLVYSKNFYSSNFNVTDLN